MAVVMPAWNDMPVQMRDNVTETCQIDFVWLIDGTKRCLDSKHNPHQFDLRIVREVAHFPTVLAQDHTTKTGIVTIFYTDNTTEIVFPEQFAPRNLAQLAPNRWLRQVGAELRNGRRILSTIFIHAPMLGRRTLENKEICHEGTASVGPSRISIAKRAQYRRCWLSAHTFLSSRPPADTWPSRPRCSPTSCRHRRCSATGPAGRTGRKSASSRRR